MENCVARIKEYRCIATRSDTTASNFAANWYRRQLAPGGNPPRFTLNTICPQALTKRC